jgi:signal transduction histidine kinase/CheY-like chemotaxis protein
LAKRTAKDNATMYASSNELACTLLNVTQTMISKLDLDELLPHILEQLANLVRYTSASIMLVEDDNLRVVARKSALGTNNAPFVIQRRSLAHIQYVVEHGQPLIIADTQRDGRWLHRSSNDAIRSWLGVPLVVKDQVIGLLNVSHAEPQFFNESDVSILRTFAAFAAITLENARLYTLEQQARVAAEQVARAKAAFLANMSHEIRTPMNAVIGAASLMLCTAMTPEQVEYIETIRSCGDDLLGVINEILDYSKFEAGHCDLESEPFALEECVEDALAVVASAAAAKAIDLSCTIADEVPAIVVGDEGRLRQVLVNLLGNAVKFTERGAVSIVVKGAPLPEESDPNASALPAGVTAVPDSLRYRLSFAVSDSGIGIAPEQVGALFQPFSQVDTTRTRKYGGTGLGLAICKRLVEMMHGTIEVESQPGIGSTFRFVVEVGSRIVDAPVVQEQIGAGKLVLVAAKPARSRHCLVDQLSKMGFTISVQDFAAHRQGEQGFDLILEDANTLGELPACKDSAVLPPEREGARVRRILVGTTRDAVPGTYAGLGYDDFLLKPIRRRALAKILADTQPASSPPAGSTGTRALPPLSVQPKPSVNGEAQETTGVGGLNGAKTGAEVCASKRLTILLAEDNVVNQKIIAHMIRKLGHDVDIVGNGAEAIQAVGVRRYDLALMDVHMPQVDGLEATLAIRALPQRGRLPILALTADALMESQQACQAAGMDGHLHKPLKIEHLCTALEPYLAA